MSTGRDKVRLVAEETLFKHCIVDNFAAYLLATFRPHLPAEFLFRNGGDALEFIDGRDSRGKASWHA